MSSDLHLHSTARNLVNVSGFGYREHGRLQQIRKDETTAALRIKRFSSVARGPRLSCYVAEHFVLAEWTQRHGHVAALKFCNP